MFSSTVPFCVKPAVRGFDTFGADDGLLAIVETTGRRAGGSDWQNGSGIFCMLTLVLAVVGIGVGLRCVVIAEAAQSARSVNAAGLTAVRTYGTHAH
jgi:hypothetical protein